MCPCKCIAWHTRTHIHVGVRRQKSQRGIASAAWDHRCCNRLRDTHTHTYTHHDCISFGSWGIVLQRCTRTLLDKPSSLLPPTLFTTSLSPSLREVIVSALIRLYLASRFNARFSATEKSWNRRKRVFFPRTSSNVNRASTNWNILFLCHARRRELNDEFRSQNETGIIGLNRPRWGTRGSPSATKGRDERRQLDSRTARICRNAVTIRMWPPIDYVIFIFRPEYRLRTRL